MTYPRTQRRAFPDLAILEKSKVKTKRSGKGISAKKIKQAASMASTKRKSGKDLLAALVKKLKSGN